MREQIELGDLQRQAERFLTEKGLMEAGKSPAEIAKSKGLVSKGYGNWADKSGKIVAKTVDGKLQPVGDTMKPKDTGVNPNKDIKPNTDFDKQGAKASP